MKRVKIAVMVLLVALVSGLQANARLAFGVKAGLNVNKMHLNHDELFDGSNRAGFTVGVMGEYTLPMIGLGVDLSLMYTRMNSEVEANIPVSSYPVGALIPTAKADYNVGKNFLEIPLNIKYKFSIPAINRIFSPMIYTGPTLALKLDGSDNSFDTKTCQWGWNVGIGLEFIRHLQISAGYTFGINNVMDDVDLPFNLGTVKPGDINMRNNYWTVTAAWLF